MSHQRKPLAIALGLNSVVLAAELAGGLFAGSLSLVLDAIHNLRAVARALRRPAADDFAIRLAYVHNLGDTALSLAPAAAGALVIAAGTPVFDSVVALGIAAFIMGATARSVAGSHQELLWPANVACAHADEGLRQSTV